MRHALEVLWCVAEAWLVWLQSESEGWEALRPLATRHEEESARGGALACPNHTCVPWFLNLGLEDEARGRQDNLDRALCSGHVQPPEGQH